jgi:protein-tyrosine phosphatase
MGVKTVINLEKYHVDLPQAGIQYVHLPTSPIHCDQLDIPALLKAIQDNPKPIFIHCQSGVDRTGLAVAAYRLDQGMSFPEAIEELHNFHVHFWWRPFIERRIAQLQQEREDGHQPSSRTIPVNSLPAL